MALVKQFLIALTAITGVLAGGYNQSCSQIRYWDPDSIYGHKMNASPYLVAKCTDTDGKDRCSFLPLTVCFSLDQGLFAFRA
ncbi:uncharacterized protein CTRU02_204207 [Colletotrichum truncatum]|uniref:Uncharacterized protein n=1 Tax=Colletotrichum truncatum TaxID=5467 RepID=A0ACC3ZBB5_COLTU|nr:uncharacterized protein CTRU02_10060 [Colletotrichum truncatum]KAF6787765.1 hypothetical protein CTRU02_10060 [Colletotrichum truncatum]